MRKLAPYHWALWGAFGLRVLGSLWDSRWHRTHGTFGEPANVLEAHWLIMLGALAMLIVPLLALRRWQEMRRNRLLAAGFLVALAFALAQFGGSVWDTGFHLQLWNLSELFGHRLETIGWFGAALGLGGVAAVYIMSTGGTAKS